MPLSLGGVLIEWKGWRSKAEDGELTVSARDSEGSGGKALSKGETDHSIALLHLRICCRLAFLDVSGRA